MWGSNPFVPTQAPASTHRGALHYQGGGAKCTQLHRTEQPHVWYWKHLVPRNSSFRSPMGLA